MNDDAPSNADLMHKLGGIEADMKHATTSRMLIHQRLEEQGRELHEVVVKMTELSVNLDITSEVAIQARNEVLNLTSDMATKYIPEIRAASTFTTESKPIIDQMKIVRNIIFALLGTGIFTIGTLIALAIWARDLFRFLVLHMISLLA